MTCIKMGSDESRFIVSLIVRDKVTRQCSQTATFLKRKESRSSLEPRSFRLPALYRHTARPNRLSISAWQSGVSHNYVVIIPSCRRRRGQAPEWGWPCPPPPLCCACPPPDLSIHQATSTLPQNASFCAWDRWLPGASCLWGRLPSARLLGEQNHKDCQHCEGK